MRRLFWISALLGAGIILAACTIPAAPVPAASPESPLAQPEETAPAEEEETSAPALDSASEAVVGMVRQMLAQQLGADADAIQVTVVEAVDWPDACLGVSQPDMMCAQVITPGYRVMVEVNGAEYEVHTDAAGRQIILASAPEA